MFSIRANLQGKGVSCQSRDIVPDYHRFTGAWTTTQECSMIVPIALHVKRNVAHALGGHSTLNARQHIQIKGTYMLMSSFTSFWNLSNSKGYSIAISGISLWKLVTMPSSPTTSAQSY
jgi:hypothetical protein